MKLPFSRRKFLGAAAASAAGVTGIIQATQWADRCGFLAPDHSGIFGAGEALTYGAQRLLVAAAHSSAREFKTSDISKVPTVNHPHPRYDPYWTLMEGNFVDWRLEVDGMVERPMFFSLDDLKRLPSRTQITQLICEEGWSYIASWTGVPLAQLLQAVGASDKAKWVVFHPFDDFWGSIDMPEALHPQTLLAYGMNGQDLPLNHGAPLRLRVPRQLGYKNLKYLARISVVDSLKDIGDGQGSAAPEYGYSWHAGI